MSGEDFRLSAKGAEAAEAPPARAAPLGRRHPSLARMVADELRRAILTGRHKPGERLVEYRLSSVMGVSRIPIREALRILAADGLVELQPRRGAVVAAISSDVAREIVEVRAMLEGLNARLAARRRNPQIIAELRDVLRRGNAAAQSGSVEELVQLNGEFHDKLAEAGKNGILWDIMRSLRERSNLIFAPNTPCRSREDWEEHASILAAVVDGDEELAALLASRHVFRAAEAAFARLQRADSEPA